MGTFENVLPWMQSNSAFLFKKRIIIPFSLIPLFWMLFVKKRSKSNKIKCKKPVADCLNDKEVDEYSIKRDGVPNLYGFTLKLCCDLMSSGIGKLILMGSNKIKKDCEILTSLYLPEKPTIFPIAHCNDVRAIDVNNGESCIDLWEYLKPSDDAPNKFKFNTISDYLEAYRTGKCTPTDVANEVITAINKCESMHPKMNLIVNSRKDQILQLAIESTKRYKNNAPLSVLDGVPVCFKDSFQVVGYPVLHGTPFLEEINGIEESESGVVKKLREGGAIIIGITNMHQFGIGATGYNNSSKHGTARNPYNPAYLCGGSSSGSGGAVAAGLGPLSLGGDAGGSCRIPAACCGIVGVKATFGRLSTSSQQSFVDTIGHPGYLCPSVRDAAICYAFLAGPDPDDSKSLHQPPVSLADFEKTDLEGVKIGIDWHYFKDVQDDVAETCTKAVDFLKKECGAKVIGIRIPELSEARMAHVICFATEMSSNSIELRAGHSHELSLDTIFTCQIGGSFTSNDYFMAQKQRTRSMIALEHIFEKVDCIITPAMATTVPKIVPGALATGSFDSNLTELLSRFCFLGNLTGIPCMSIPVGYGKGNMPIGLQVMTKWWNEAMMFRVAHAAENFLEIKKEPKVHFNLINEQ